MVSILGCDRCALQVDTDYDVETLVETDAGVLCPECADYEGVYHPYNAEPGECDELSEIDEWRQDDDAQRCADMNEVLR